MTRRDFSSMPLTDSRNDWMNGKNAPFYLGASTSQDAPQALPGVATRLLNSDLPDNRPVYGCVREGGCFAAGV